MNAIKIIIATIIVCVLLNYDYVVMNFLYFVFFDLSTFEEHVNKYPALWKITVFGTVCYLTIYPFITFFVSMILKIAKDQLKYVFIAIAAIFSASHVIAPLMLEEAKFWGPRLAFDVVICLVAAAMCYTKFDEDEKPEESQSS